MPTQPVGMGKDDTLFAKAAGFLEFTEGRRGRVVNVVSADAQAQAEAASPSERAVPVT